MKYLASANRWSVSSGLGMAYASLMVLLLSFLKSTQNRIVPSFFLTITTLEEYGLWLGLIAPASSISARCSRTSWNNAGGMRRCGSLNGSLSINLILCFTKSQLPKSVIPFEKIPFHLERKVFIWVFCSSVTAKSVRSTPSCNCCSSGAVSSTFY